MSAIRLRTGSPTRPLTADEIERIAMRLAAASGHFYDTAQKAEGVDQADVFVGPVEHLPEHCTGDEAMEAWQALPQWVQEYWIGIARQTATCIFETLGDRVLNLPEDRH